jgi:hypothetical protein
MLPWYSWVIIGAAVVIFVVAMIVKKQREG